MQLPLFLKCQQHCHGRDARIQQLGPCAYIQRRSLRLKIWQFAKKKDRVRRLHTLSLPPVRGLFGKTLTLSICAGEVLASPLQEPPSRLTPTYGQTAGTES